ncbi:uncharacterized protein MELLADRAFT_113999 [Melampsora larici-populina 98AG31]|uniref:Uncharacterized protein n=1 Tax=Melampsora larici-populina (strain 98AG31 / pathotype 3-4-7) TaxID=747676 RepID=F4SBT2_MELLP|nr:uncharacterized protein MELLADRAFT_113999 [Melampsora larici-populina 98AG31]EGF97882.1 hypothetical protein MELLADRAFT_113999 [Melampsora larici-populina 98AG31]
MSSCELLEPPSCSSSSPPHAKHSSTSTEVVPLSLGPSTSFYFNLNQTYKPTQETLPIIDTHKNDLAYKVLKPRIKRPDTKDTPLILIHGLGAVGLIDWSPIAELLSYDRTVVVFDNRDIGWSRLSKGRENDR